MGVDDLVRSGVGGIEGIAEVHVREQMAHVGDKHLKVVVEIVVIRRVVYNIPCTYNEGSLCSVQGSVTRDTNWPSSGNWKLLSIKRRPSWRRDELATFLWPRSSHGGGQKGN